MTQTQQECFIVAAKRTPTGTFGKTFLALSATDLGSIAIKSCLESANIDPSIVQEVFMGNVLSAGLGQNPARQAALSAGLSQSVPCTTINKVCASGMKATIFGVQSVLLGQNDCVVVGGMENMSQCPYYLQNNRFGSKFGNGAVLDGIVKDGLENFETKELMGCSADETATEMNITREEQDTFAISSYEKAQAAAKSGESKNEICPVFVKGRPDTTVTEDPDIWTLNPEKLRKLRPAFDQTSGTVTAANASSLNDGASALVLMSGDKMRSLGLTPLAKIRGWADAAREPGRFTLAPALAVPKALKHANLSKDDVDYFEINEAFSVVALGNARMLDIPEEKLNAFGGAVSSGHPLGSSGSRIIVTLVNVLKSRGGKIGCAGVCNGGGGASSIVIENC